MYDLIPEKEDYTRHDMLQYIVIAFLSILTIAQSFMIAENTQSISTNTKNIDTIVDYITENTSTTSSSPGTHSIDLSYKLMWNPNVKVKPYEHTRDNELTPEMRKVVLN